VPATGQPWWWGLVLLIPFLGGILLALREADKYL